MGYDKTDTSNYEDNSLESSRVVKFLASSYTSDETDINGNPQYISGSGDLDFCNGIFSKTPEYPQGIYHYICTIKLNSTKTAPLLVDNSEYGFRNITKQVIAPAYPYIIGAYKGIPEISNFPWTTTLGSVEDTSSEKKKFTFNFRSLKSNDVSVNGESVKSISMTQDNNYINMLVNPQNYKWNFSNTQGTSILGRDDYKFGNQISSLRSLSTDTTFKAYGNVTKWVSGGTISKGTCVRISVSSDALVVETYNLGISGLSEAEVGAAPLGIALNDAITGGDVYVCTKGITTVILNRASIIKCGSYGYLSSTNTSGKIDSLGDTGQITSNLPIIGYFLETFATAQSEDSLVLFQVSTNYEFS